MTVAELLSSKEKWCAGVDETADGRMCLVRALAKAYKDRSIDDLQTAQYKLRSAAVRLFPKRKAIPGDGYSLVFFNDTHTYEEVMQVVHEAGV